MLHIFPDELVNASKGRVNFMILPRCAVENKDFMDQIKLDHIIVSINEPNPFNVPAMIPTTEFCKERIVLFFDDIDKQMSKLDFGLDRELVLFSQDQAKTVVDRIKSHIVSGRFIHPLIIVHCHAGVSRSAGMAEALSLWLNGDDSGIGSNTRFIPNRHVKSTMLRVLMENQ